MATVKPLLMLAALKGPKMGHGTHIQSIRSTSTQEVGNGASINEAQQWKGRQIHAYSCPFKKRI